MQWPRGTTKYKLNNSFQISAIQVVHLNFKMNLCKVQNVTLLKLNTFYEKSLKSSNKIQKISFNQSPQHGNSHSPQHGIIY
jgi:hypothetical protein